MTPICRTRFLYASRNVCLSHFLTDSHKGRKSIFVLLLWCFCLQDYCHCGLTVDRIDFSTAESEILHSKVVNLHYPHD